jgi:hypothetical protein
MIRILISASFFIFVSLLSAQNCWAQEKKELPVQSSRMFLNTDIGGGFNAGLSGSANLRLGMFKEWYGFSLGVSSLVGPWSSFQVPECVCNVSTISSSETLNPPSSSEQVRLDSISLGFHVVSEVIRYESWNLWSQIDYSYGEVHFEGLGQRYDVGKFGFEFGWVKNFINGKSQNQNTKLKVAVSHQVAKMNGTMESVSDGDHVFLQSTQLVGGIYYFF